MRFRASASLLVVLLLLAVSSAQRGALVLPRSLEELTAQSERIVHANVVSAKVEPHPQYPRLKTVVVTVRVQETLKGSAAEQITFRQFIWDFRDKQDAAGYRKGQEVVLFLNKTTKDGLTSTAGLDQGRLLVEHDVDGRAVVHPKTPSRIFFRNLDSTLAKRNRVMLPSVRSAGMDSSRGIRLGDLKQTVRDLVAVRGGK